jgi:3,4-dihydroxy-2-butanone 4-phosphate synthase
VTQTVDFDFTAANGIQAFQVRATYDVADGNFTGSAENVNCTVTGGGGIFTKNDNDTGALTLSVANTSNLTFPVNVECTFDATSGITAADITVTVQEVTQNNAPGNAADLTVAVTVS